MKKVKTKPNGVHSMGKLARFDPAKAERNKKRKLQQHIRAFPSDHAAQKLFTERYGEPATKNSLGNLLAVARHKMRAAIRRARREAPIEVVS